MLARVTIVLIAAFLVLTPGVGRADLSPYNQDFEGLNQADSGALGGDGWLVFGNVFDPGWGYAYGYGVFPAPNGTPGFCSVAAGEGGPDQGAQQIVVYNDYNNTDHGIGFFIEANVFRESVVGAGDVGSTWFFQFDAKHGDLAGSSTAIAFIKTLNPAAGYATTNFLPVDMTSIPDTWNRYAISLHIDAGLVGQIVQYGFASTTTGYQPSGMLYDNVDFRALAPTVNIDPNVINLDSHAPLVTVYLEMDGFDIGSVDPTSLRLAGSIVPSSKFAVIGDHNLNDVPDLMVKFSRSDLDPLLTPGVNNLTITGALVSGETFSGSDAITVIDPPMGSPAASISPNPLNPAGVLSFRTATSGPVAVRMFDLNGRLVRTLLEKQVVPAGTHEVSFDGRDRSGASLPSGVYFYRVETPEGVAKGQFSILK